MMIDNDIRVTKLFSKRMLLRRLAKILFWSLIATLFCSGTVMADALPSLSADAVNYHTDISMTYLGMVFGHVGSAIQGMSGEMLGKVIYRFNEGVLIVAGIVLFYTTVLTMFRGAYDNLFSSQNRSTVLLVGRMAIGFGLLLPIPQSNYNTIQIVLMKIVKESVVLADMTWDNTLDYLQYGGHIFEVPDSTGTGATPEYLAATDKKYLDAVVAQSVTSNPTVTDSLIQRMFINEVCMYQSQLTPNSNSESNQDSSQIWNDAENPNLNPFIQVDSKSNRTIIFPSSQKDKKGVCGTIDVLSYFNALDKAKLVTNSDASNIKNTLLPNLLLQTAESVAPAAKAYVCTQPGAGNSNKALCLGVGKLPVAESMAADAFYDGYLNYTTGALRLQEIGQQSNSGNSKTSFIKQAKADGWVMAGAYYYNLSVFTAQAAAAVAPTDYVGTEGVNFPFFIKHPISSSPCSNPQTSAQTAVCQSSDFLSKIVAGTSTQIVQYASKISSGAGDAIAANKSHPAKLNKSIGMWVGGAGDLSTAIGGGLMTLGIADPLSIAQIVIIVNAITSLINLIVSFSTSSGLGINPIVFLHHIGLQCFNVAGDILLGTLLAALIVSIVTGFCRGQVDLANSPKIWNEWMKPMVIACSGMFLFAGAFNVFFVPCYPYFVFAIGVIGWLIMVIEAVVAMPLVALGLTHPEQHELLGKSEQTMMLILSVFLRPSLLVMGLVIAIVLSMVGYTMVIYLFGLLVYSVFSVAYVGSVWGALLEMILVIPMLFLIFCSIVYTMTTKCYQLTTSLTDSVMAWIGVPQQPDQGVERSLRELESTASAGMQKAGSAVQSGSSGLPGPEKPSGSSLAGSK